MRAELPALLERLRTLADERTSDVSDELLERIEHTLTDGYAHALALEAECMRLEREIGASVARVRRGDHQPLHLKNLADRLASTEEEIRVLRGLLESLRQRAHGIRTGEPLIGG